MTLGAESDNCSGATRSTGPDAREAALIETELARDGRPLAIPDMTIAAARQRGGSLLTADGTLRDVEHPEVVNYRAD